MMKSKTSQHTQVQTETTILTPLEEQVVRMRQGFSAPANLRLETKAGNNPEVLAQLQAMEQKALGAVGARSSSTKRKIVSALRRKK